MNDELPGKSVQERTLQAIDQLLTRTLDHINGMERGLLRQAVNLLYPRLRQRVLSASEEEIRAEVEYLHRLSSAVLGSTSQAPAASTENQVRRRPVTARRHRRI
ncbi:hypothetical protein [Alicyclobacillus herbarius]|uniref:hypothetical protein n=1 Tax=Alicyclobacillus herbarius TaxID=122960 RepID=UPI000422A1CC|nr:hypothetical protein [Alicyclobacillus herbarius]